MLLGGLGTSDLGGQLEVAVLSASQLGRMTALVLVLAGLGLIGSAWITLCRDAARDLVDVLHVRAAVCAWSAPLLFAPPLFSRDGWSYAAQGAMTQLGLSPYVWTPNVLHGPLREAVDPMWTGTPAPYGPLPLQWGAVAAEFTRDPWALVVAHRLLALVGLALLAWAVPRIAAWTRVKPALASALALGSPLMIANGVGGLHNDVLMAGLAAAALVVAVERGWVWGAAVAGLAAAVKVPGGLVCIPVVLLSLPAAATLTTRVRRLAAAGCVSVGALVVAGLPRGPRHRMGACPRGSWCGRDAAVTPDDGRQGPRRRRRGPGCWRRWSRWSSYSWSRCAGRPGPEQARSGVRSCSWWRCSR